MKGEELRQYLQNIIQELQNIDVDKTELEKFASQMLDTITYNCGPEEYDLIGEVYEKHWNIS